jgi:hypothetical protein
VLERSWDTASAALAACARALGDRRSVGEIAFASGLAFRLSVDAEISLAGPHAYPFAEVLPAAAARLGFACEVVSSSERPDSALHAEARRRARALIERGLTAGRPTLIWGVHAPEFGLAVGATPNSIRVSGILDGAAPPELPDLGLGDVPIVFALQLTERISVDEDAALHAALLFGRGPAPTLSGFFTGASAWRAVEAALQSGRVDPAGLGYSAQRWAESRSRVAEQLAIPDAKRAFARAAAMLTELAGLHAFPGPQMLTSSMREQSLELVVEAALAEAAGLEAIAVELRARQQRAVEELRLVDLHLDDRKELFACVRELPLPLEEEARACRENGAFSGKLLFDKSGLVGHVLWAPLEEARQPIVAQGKRWFLFCPWIAHPLRGRGAGPRLMTALEETARAAGVDGILTFATDDPRFLYLEGLARLGFSEIGRRGDLHLMERPLTETPSYARFAELPPPAGRLEWGDAQHCPLLLHTRRSMAGAAREAGISVAESQTEMLRLDGHDLPHGYIPAAALLAHLSRS